MKYCKHKSEVVCGRDCRCDESLCPWHSSRQGIFALGAANIEVHFFHRSLVVVTMTMLVKIEDDLCLLETLHTLC